MKLEEDKWKIEMDRDKCEIELGTDIWITWYNISLVKELKKSWSPRLEQHIIEVATKIEKLVLKVHWFEIPEDFKPSQRQISLVSDNFFSNIFWAEVKKLRNKKIFDKEELLLYVKKTLEDNLNWTEALENDKVKVWIYFSADWNNWFVDILDKDKERKKAYYTNEEFIKKLGIVDDDEICSKNWDFKFIDEKTWYICVGSILDWWNYIFHFDWLNEFQKEIIEKMFDKIIDVVKEKLNSIESNYIDRLTWCKNSTYFNEHKKEKNWSVIYIDLDDFKYINDTFWHPGWDEVLKKIWKLLRWCARENEVCRMWWDEFCIMIKHDKKWNFLDILKKIVSRLEHLENKKSLYMNLPVLGEQFEKEIEIKFTKGVFKNENETDALEEWYSKADETMLETKASEKSDESYIYRIFSNFSKFSKEKQKSLLTLLAKKLGFNIEFK